MVESSKHVQHTTPLSHGRPESSPLLASCREVHDGRPGPPGPQVADGGPGGGEQIGQERGRQEPRSVNDRLVGRKMT